MENDKIQESITELKLSVGTIQTEQRQMMKEITRITDNFTDGLNKLSEKYEKLKTAEDRQTAIQEYQKFNRQTFSRPLLVGIIVLIISLGLTCFINFKTQEQMNKTASAFVDAVKSIKDVKP